MIAYNEESRKLRTYKDGKYWDILEKYFPNKEWGCVVYFEGKGIFEFPFYCEINKVSSDGTWSHYANLQLYDDGEWELNEQLCGESKEQMFIYGYFSSFARAVRSLYLKGTSTNGRKPIKIY